MARARNTGDASVAPTNTHIFCPSYDVWLLVSNRTPNNCFLCPNVIKQRSSSNHITLSVYFNSRVEIYCCAHNVSIDFGLEIFNIKMDISLRDMMDEWCGGGVLIDTALRNWVNTVKRCVYVIWCCRPTNGIQHISYNTNECKWNGVVDGKVRSSWPALQVCLNCNKSEWWKSIIVLFINYNNNYYVD